MTKISECSGYPDKMCSVGYSGNLYTVSPRVSGWIVGVGESWLGNSSTASRINYLS